MLKLLGEKMTTYSTFPTIKNIFQNFLKCKSFCLIDFIFLFCVVEFVGMFLDCVWTREDGSFESFQDSDSENEDAMDDEE